MKNVSAQLVHNSDWRNQVTVALWIIALSSHLILIPMLIRELYQGFVHGKKE